MKKYFWFRLIISLRKDLGIIFIITLSTIFLLDFWLINVSELFHGAEKLAGIIYKLCLSYISAFIFYFLVVHFNRQRDKKNTYGYVVQKTDKIISCATTLILEMKKATKITFEGKYPTERELIEMCKLINPNANAPLILFAPGDTGRYANWIQYLDELKRQSNEATKRIFLQMPFLDSDLINILASIEDCNHFNGLKYMLIVPVKNPNLTGFQSSIAEYFKLVNNLEIYSYNKLKQFKGKE